MSNLKNKTLNRTEFRNFFIKPLEKTFGFKVYWNGAECKNAGLEELSSDANGTSFSNEKGFPIVLRFKKNNVLMLSVLIHEYAHSYLHRKGVSGYDLCRNAYEIEAETVSLKVFKLLGIPYGNQLIYINRHQEQYHSKKGEYYKFGDRENLLNEFSFEIFNLLKNNISLIKSLNDTDPTRKRISYKYRIQCEVCGKQWYYKRKTNIIKKNAKGCWCGGCGKEKSLNLLTVTELL